MTRHYRVDVDFHCYLYIRNPQLRHCSTIYDVLTFYWVVRPTILNYKPQIWILLYPCWLYTSKAHRSWFVFHSSYQDCFNIRSLDRNLELQHRSILYLHADAFNRLEPTPRPSSGSIHRTLLNTSIFIGLTVLLFAHNLWASIVAIRNSTEPFPIHPSPTADLFGK